MPIRTKKYYSPKNVVNKPNIEVSEFKPKKFIGYNFLGYLQTWSPDRTMRTTEAYFEKNGSLYSVEVFKRISDDNEDCEDPKEIYFYIENHTIKPKETGMELNPEDETDVGYLDADDYWVSIGHLSNKFDPYWLGNIRVTASFIITAKDYRKAYDEVVKEIKTINKKMMTAKNERELAECRNQIRDYNKKLKLLKGKIDKNDKELREEARLTEAQKKQVEREVSEFRENYPAEKTQDVEDYVKILTEFSKPMITYFKKLLGKN